MPFFSLIIPVYNGAAHLPVCLRAVWDSIFEDWELIVVDDGSTDDSAAIAQQWGARVLTTNGRNGPAAARNLGAREANGHYLFFTDSDCQLRPDTLQQAAHIFWANPDLDALIGAYDNSPAAPNFLSQYKNLFHHYIHQTSQPEARTFWTGCGAINREVFLESGGFDARRYPRPGIEDIEFGYRLVQQGRKIRLAAMVQVKHLKQWQWHTLLRSDIFDRALPWAKLLREKEAIPADLNLQWSHRISALMVLMLLGSVAAVPFFPWSYLFIIIWAVILIGLNRQLYQFFFKQCGVFFTLRAILWHWFYYFYSSAAFVVGTLLAPRRK
jgi:glycosyltransferase involved in cell wall biosynthesis